MKSYIQKALSLCLALVVLSKPLGASEPFDIAKCIGLMGAIHHYKSQNSEMNVSVVKSFEHYETVLKELLIENTSPDFNGKENELIRYMETSRTWKQFWYSDLLKNGEDNQNFLREVTICSAYLDF